MIEVGVPFSDPLADGPVIQRATERALASGTTLAGVLDLLAASCGPSMRAGVVIFSYANPILRLGAERSPIGPRRPASTACSCSTCRSKKPASSARCWRRGD